MRNHRIASGDKHRGERSARRGGLPAAALAGLLVLTASVVSAAETRTAESWRSVYEPYVSPEGQTYDGKGHEWANNRYGYSDRTPAPWTDLARKGEVVDAWGRRYDFGGELLVGRIDVRGEPLLAAPVSLEVEIDGEKNPGRGPVNREWAPDDPRRARATVSQTIGAARVRCETYLDFDGFLRFDLVLDAPKGTRIDGLRVNIPYRGKVARQFIRYLAYDYDMMRNNRFMVLDSMGDIEAPEEFSFRPTVWVGDDRRGMEWVCETNIDWSNRSPETAMAFLPGNDMLTLQARLVDRPIVMAGPLCYSFALLPTPMKPGLPNRWGHIVASGQKQAIKFREEIEKDPSKLKIWLLAWFNAAGLRYGGLPLPFPDGPERKKYDELRAGLQAHDAHIIPYGALTCVFKAHPAVVDFYDSWALTDKLQGCWGWGRHAGLPKGEPAGLPVDFNAKSAQDFLVGQQVRAIEEFGHRGLYYDVHEVSHNGAEKRYGDKGVDLSAKLYHPMYGFHETMRRLWIATKERDPGFLITCHSGLLTPFAATYVDLALCGEIYNTLFRKDAMAESAKTGHDFSGKGNPFKDKPGPLQFKKPNQLYQPNYFDIPEDDFAVYVNQNRGYDFHLLPQVVKFNNDYMREHPEELTARTREMLACALVYDIPFWITRSDNDLIVETLHTLFQFGLLDDGVTFIPMDETPSRIEVGAPDAERSPRVAGWTLPGRALVVASNPNAKPLRLALRPLSGLAGASGPAQTVRNAETGESIASGDGGKVEVEIPPKDFRLIDFRFD